MTINHVRVPRFCALTGYTGRRDSNPLTARARAANRWVNSPTEPPPHDPTNGQ